MAGALKKTMIYLGLADGEDYPQASQEPADHSTRHASRQESRTSAVESDSAVPSTAGDSVVSLAPRPVAAESDEAGAVTATHNRTNLALDPDYRAPVTPIKRAPSSRDESSTMRKITTVHPRSYNDAKLIGESFRDEVPVIMNVTEMGEAEAKRLVDFSAGLVFGLGGSIERVTNKVFLLTPKNVEVLAEEQAPTEDESNPSFFNQS